MNCQDYRDRVAIHLVDAAEPAPGDHGASCPECGRYAELARAAWEAAGRSPDEAPPPGLVERFHLSCRRPRRADLTLLRPGPLAAAALLALGAIVLLRPGPAGRIERPMYWSDGMSVERYALPAGADAARVAEELRKEVSPEDWGEGACAVEIGEGFLRVRGTAEVQEGVREYLEKLPKK
jgi:hypothetical protein